MKASKDTSIFESLTTQQLWLYPPGSNTTLPGERGRTPRPNPQGVSPARADATQEIASGS